MAAELILMPAFPSNAFESHYRGPILLGCALPAAVSRDWGGCGGGEVKLKMPSLGRAIVSRRL